MNTQPLRTAWKTAKAVRNFMADRPVEWMLPTAVLGLAVVFTSGAMSGPDRAPVGPTIGERIFSSETIIAHDPPLRSEEPQRVASTPSPTVPSGR